MHTAMWTCTIDVPLGMLIQKNSIAKAKQSRIHEYIEYEFSYTNGKIR